MGELKLSVNVAIVAAVIIGEVVSMIWYSNVMPWGSRSGDRYMIAAIICDIGLAFLLQAIIGSHWSVRSIEDAAIMSMWLTLLYVCLEAPHLIHNSGSLSHFFFHALHKYVLMFSMSLALHHFKNY